jgi:1-acyl-sn-glycerol-3-phosphate acyltransferase
MAVMVVSTVVLGAVAVLGSVLRPGSDVTLRLARWWSRAILGAAGVRVRVDDESAGGVHSRVLFLCNHASMIDIWAVVRAVPDATCFVAKQSLFRVPFLGWAMAAGGFVAVDRADRGRAVRSLGRAAERLAQGKSLILFPEGTRSRDGHLGPFKKGPFHLAIETGRPIVPVAIQGAHALLPPGAWCPRPGEVRVRLAPPVQAGERDRKDLAALMAEVRAAVAARLAEPPAV